MEILTCDQGSPEWFAARLGLPTASMFSTVMAKGQGKTRRTYMLKLAGEIITGECADSYTSSHMERGKEMEADARAAYAFMQDAEPELVGFITDGTKGCSPDALVGDDGMTEIKTKLAHLQIDCLLRDAVPSEHVAQCQGNLWVAEREWIDFVSYWPKLPLFVKRVHRDEKYITGLAEAVDTFRAELAELVEQIRRYGGEERKAA